VHKISVQVEASFSFIHITGTVMGAAVNVRVSEGFLRMWKSSVEREGFTSQQLIPFHRMLMPLFTSQGLLPFMRQYSWTEWQDGGCFILI
jgi:hypothetical protein